MIEPDTDEDKNLVRVIKNIQEKFLPLIMPIKKSVNLQWCVHAAFVLHKDTGSHIGGFMIMGTVWAYLQSIKQKLYTNISSEDKLVGVDHVLTQIIWT